MRTRSSRPPSASTVAATLTIGVVTVAFIVYAGIAIIGVDPTNASRDAVLLGLSGREEGSATLIVSVVILALSMLTALQCLGVARRRQGARHAALVTFGMLSFVSLAAGLTGLQAVPRAPNAWYGVLVGMLDAAVVVLLLLPSTADDFELAERDRDRRTTRV
ncbi:MAG TPA: hypothetical protein VFZ70_05100 [Euzebyales bacterium]